MDGEWAAGIARVPFQEIVLWSDYFDSQQGIKGVKENGFQYTLVCTSKDGDFISTWDRLKFEEKLNEYVENYEKWANEQLEYHIKMIEKLQKL